MVVAGGEVRKAELAEVAQRMTAAGDGPEGDDEQGDAQAADDQGGQTQGGVLAQVGDEPERVHPHPGVERQVVLEPAAEAAVGRQEQGAGCERSSGRQIGRQRLMSQPEAVHREPGDGIDRIDDTARKPSG